MRVKKYFGRAAAYRDGRGKGTVTPRCGKLYKRQAWNGIQCMVNGIYHRKVGIGMLLPLLLLIVVKGWPVANES
jgi:hypothetical protein